MNQIKLTKSIFTKKYRRKYKNQYTISLLIITLLFSLIILTSCNNNRFLEVHIIDVDQGDSTLIVTPHNKTILIDAGKEKFSRNVIRELKKSGIKNLDYVIGTHYDEDHIGGIDRVLKEINAGIILLPTDKSNPPELTEIKYQSRINNIKIDNVRSDTTLKVDENTTLHVLSPDQQYDDSNQNSIVFILKYLDHFLLFTGDADTEIEKKILNRYKLPKCTLLKVAHHGSKHSSSDEFLEEISPRISTISCGYKNSYGHPHKDVIYRLKNINTRIYRTDINGTMIFYFNKESVFTDKKYRIDN